jgi:hypothetical protein
MFYFWVTLAYVLGVLTPLAVFYSANRPDPPYHGRR